MHLKRGYAWSLDLSEKELNVIEDALDIVVKENDLSEDTGFVAEKLLNTIRMIREKINQHKLERDLQYEDTSKD